MLNGVNIVKKFAGAGLFAVLVLASACAARADPAPGYSGWLGVVVAGDYRDSSGQPIPVFDNARKTIVERLIALGFKPQNITTLSAAAANGAEPAGQTIPLNGLRDVDGALNRLRGQATEGCFIYFTSHGQPGAIYLGEASINPGQLKRVVAQNCGARPTVMFISSCYSGSFLTAEMRTPNRMIMTAAQSDRPSFGCGANLEYTYFDGCFLEAEAGARDFLDLAERTKACVSRREAEQHMQPSLPQVYIGESVLDVLRAKPFLRHHAAHD